MRIIPPRLSSGCYLAKAGKARAYKSKPSSFGCKKKKKKVLKLRLFDMMCEV